MAGQGPKKGYLHVSGAIYLRYLTLPFTMNYPFADPTRIVLPKHFWNEKCQFFIQKIGAGGQGERGGKAEGGVQLISHFEKKKFQN